MSKEKMMSIVIVVLVVAVVLFVVFFGAGKMSKPLSSVNNAALDSVASVNGVPIPRASFDAQLAIATTTYKTQGVDVADATKLAAIRTQVLNDLINNELVAQGVKSSGTLADDAEVETQFQNILKQSGGADKLKAQMTAANLTEAKLKDNITKQLTIQKFLLKNVDISTATSSDAEIKKFYDDNTKGLKTPPKLKDVKEQIRQQIITNKQQQLINAFLTALRAKSDVKTSF